MHWPEYTFIALGSIYVLASGFEILKWSLDQKRAGTMLCRPAPGRAWVLRTALLLALSGALWIAFLLAVRKGLLPGPRLFIGDWRSNSIENFVWYVGPPLLIVVIVFQMAVGSVQKPRLCRNGLIGDVLSSFQFIPWEKIIDYEWIESSGFTVLSLNIDEGNSASNMRIPLWKFGFAKPQKRNDSVKQELDQILKTEIEFKRDDQD